MDRTPFLIVGDGPQEATGLGRIARDLAGALHTSDLPVQVVQLGGTVPPVWTQWPHYPLNPVNEDWGASQVEAFYRDLWGQKPGVLLVVWDPGRLYPYLGVKLPVQKWAYTAIDATNVRGSLGGPGAAALMQFDRVLAYTKWAAYIVEGLRGTPGPYLPHGLRLDTFGTPITTEERAGVEATLGAYHRPGMTLVGCVATNQPRKDLGMFVQTLAELRRRGRNVYGWLHTDSLVKAWSVPQLVEDCDLAKRITVTGLGEEFTDRQLAAMYQACDLTIAPGLGEGFCYPIAESLASGTLVVHGDYAGGAELIPTTAWRVPAREWRIEGVYALKRPVFRVEDWANAAERALRWRETVGAETSRAYCRGAVAHLDWQHLWPRWRSWFRQGLDGR